MFQLHYAIPIFGLGFLVGALMWRSLWIKAIVVLFAFATTFGLGWGAFTLLELALGFVLGNSIFGRRVSTVAEAQRPISAGMSAVTPITPNNQSTQTPLRISSGSSVKCTTCGHSKVMDDNTLNALQKSGRAIITQESEPNGASTAWVDARKLRCTNCRTLGSTTVL